MNDRDIRGIAPHMERAIERLITSTVTPEVDNAEVARRAMHRDTTSPGRLIIVTRAPHTRSPVLDHLRSHLHA